MGAPEACPRCGSEDVGRSRGLRRRLLGLSLFSLLLMWVFFLLPFLAKFECGECGYRWSK